MLTDRDRLHRRAALPRLLALHRALSRLTSTVTVMNTGAHPDDEQSGMLAALRFEKGMRVIIACSTRGEGGQNTLGPERSGPLGVLRSREMEEAARTLDADVVWLGHGPDDPVHDFGFSKSGLDTLARWGHERLTERLVRAYRQFRPDIVIPTFLDVPGQHGHHRAMTEIAEAALAMAADPTAFPEHAAENLKPWQVSKYYLPAWSGGDETYDDETPPPPVTTVVSAGAFDPATGLSYDRIGEMSRRHHASQNMGHWRLPAQMHWPLHLRRGATEKDIGANLPARLADLGTSPALIEADAAIAAAIAVFPDSVALIETLATAKAAVTSAIAAQSGDDEKLHSHRLIRKQAEIDVALALATGLDVSLAVSSANVVPGGTLSLTVAVETGKASDLIATPLLSDAFEPAMPVALSEGRAEIPLKARDDAPIRNAYEPGWLSLGGNGAVAMRLDGKVRKTSVSLTLDCEEAVQIVPPYQATITPDALVVPLSRNEAQRIMIRSMAESDQISIDSVDGLIIAPMAQGFAVRHDTALKTGRYSLPVRINGMQAHSVTPIAYPHIGRTHFVQPLTLEILALDIVLPQARVGYIGGGNDRVDLWLNRMGMEVTGLDAAALTGDLSRYDTIVIGIFAFGTRPDLGSIIGKLHNWTEKGGHLVTLYHRPSDGWQPDRTPPRPITIGSPSLRWRTTNPAAPVTFLAPGHKLLTGPNTITDADFQAWDKERGLYFASAWDSAYEPLLAMSDEGETTLSGSLLSAKIGQGRHTHTSLVLHHQLEKLVPGAFRLLANLVQAA